MFKSIIQGVIIGAVFTVVWVAAMLVARRLNLVRGRKCPRCEEELPLVRKPANRRQLLRGGWTCPKCSCEVDFRGREVRP
jgi:hypothetical protein